MGIIKIQIGQPGVVDIIPQPVYINTSDTYAQVTTLGYLSSAQAEGYQFSNQQFAQVYTTDLGSVALNITVNDDVVSLIPQQIITASSFQYLNTSITLTDWLDMYASPKTILTAPGANAIITVIRAMIYQTQGSGFLSNGGNVGFQYGTTPNLAGLLATNTASGGVFGGSPDSRCTFFVGNSGAGSSGTPPNNLPVTLSNDTAAFTGGTGIQFNIHIWYAITGLTT